MASHSHVFIGAAELSASGDDWWRGARQTSMRLLSFSACWSTETRQRWSQNPDARRLIGTPIHEPLHSKLGRVYRYLTTPNLVFVSHDTDQRHLGDNYLK